MKQLYAPYPFNYDYSLRLFKMLRVGDLLSLNRLFCAPAAPTTFIVIDIQLFQLNSGYGDVSLDYPECVRGARHANDISICTCPACNRKYVNTVIYGIGSGTKSRSIGNIRSIYANTLGYYDLTSAV